MNLAVVLIHNQSHDRLRVSRALAESIVTKVQKLSWDCELFEVFDQPVVTPIGRFTAVQVRFLEHLAQLTYFLTNPQINKGLFLPHAALALASPFASFSSKQTRERMRIDSFISNKHARAWAYAESHDFVLVLEDDAIEQGDLTSLLVELIALCEMRAQGFLYVDLAGGYEMRFPRCTPNSKLKAFLELNGLTTNTACGYLVNKSLGLELKRSFLIRPASAKIGIDFFMNSVFTRIRKKPWSCFHATPESAIRHGSMVGSYSSWDKSRAAK